MRKRSDLLGEIKQVHSFLACVVTSMVEKLLDQNAHSCCGRANLGHPPRIGRIRGRFSFVEQLARA